MIYSELLSQNEKLGSSMTGLVYHVRVLSNIIVTQIKEILEYTLRTSGINAAVTLGNYDNIIQDSSVTDGVSLVILFWEACNLVNGFHYKSEIDPEKSSALVEQVKARMDLVFKNLEKVPLVIMNRFSSLLFNPSLKPSVFDGLCQTLNRHLDEIKPRNIFVADTDRILSRIALEKNMDARFFYSSKLLYTVDFFREYSDFILPVARAACGKMRKALIFDCDNTLWKGILGENGPEGIEMSSRTPDGSVFEEVQTLALALSRQGVLLGLCSKNNSTDVDKVLSGHPDMVLRDADFSIKMVNWSDKAENLRAIAKKLNIGTDSLVFVDDSDFEIGLVRQQLPEITALKVPSRLQDYPMEFRKWTDYFFSLSVSKEDMAKTRQYKEKEKRDESREKFSSLQDYLRSIGLKLTLWFNNTSQIERLSQMTQKTNQFNLTTRRYTENDIRNLLKETGLVMASFAVSDTFGDDGLTGLAIIWMTKTAGTAEIDSFLMSCRVIGRNVELAFFDRIVKELGAKGVKTLLASYVHTLKNEQVISFYEKLGFRLIKETVERKDYSLEIKEYKAFNLDYVEVRNG